MRLFRDKINTMPLTPQDFVSKWKRVTSREKQTYQEHFIDLCRLVDHRTPNEADPTGKRYAFEMGTAKTSGGQGWADVAKLGYFGWGIKARIVIWRRLTTSYYGIVILSITRLC